LTGFEIIEDFPGDNDYYADMVAWISQPSQRDIGVQARIQDDLSLELRTYSDKTLKEYDRIFLSPDELQTLLEFITYAKNRWRG